jgi:hypothetical protein
MLNWFYDTPIVRAVLEMEKQPIFKTKTDFAKREEQKRDRARIKRKKKQKAKKRNSLK